MSYYELAKLIRQNFTPLAFLCSCNGEDPSCREAMDDRGTYIQFDTVRRIADMLEGMEPL